MSGSDEEPPAAKQMRTEDAQESPVSTFAEILGQFNVSTIIDVFPPLSSKNSGIVLTNEGKESLDKNQNKEENGQMTLPRISRAVNMETGQKYVFKVLPINSSVFEEQVLRSAFGTEDNGFLVGLVNSFCLPGARKLFILHEAHYGNLNELLSRVGSRPLDSSTCARISTSLTSGLDFLHSRLISHGFLNPEHCLLDEICNIRLCGLGNLYKGQRASTYRWIDNKCRTIYFAPEVCYPEKSVDPLAVDMFACGVILHRCLLGIFPKSASPSAAALDALIRKVKPLAQHSRPKKPQKLANVKQNAVSDEMEEPLKVVRDLLLNKPSSRPGAHAVLNGAWIQRSLKQHHILPSSVFFQY